MGGKKGNKSKKSKTKLTGKERLQQLGRAPKTLGTSEAAKRFKEREAKGLDGFTGMRKVTDAERKQGKTQLTQYRDAQRKWVSDQAAKRNAAYRAEKNKSATQRQVDKDNAMYGNTFPSGSFAISEEGKKQAKENKAIQAAKSSTFDANKLSFNMDTNPFVGQSFLAGGFNQPGRLGSWFDKGLNVRVPNEANASFGRLFNDDISQLGKFTNKQGKVEGGLFNTGIPKNFRQVKQLFTGKGGLGFSFGSGIGTGPTPLGRQAVRRFLPYAGQISLGRDIFNYGGSEQLANFADNTIGKINPYAGTTDQSPELNAAAAARERGPLLSIGGFNVPEFGLSEYMGINTVDRTPKDVQVASTDAGGLNIGSGEAEGSNTGRTLTARFNKPGFDTLAGGLDFATNDKFDFDNLGKGLFGYGAVTPSNVINDAMSIAQNKNLTVKDMGAFLNTIKDVSTSDDKLNTVKNILSNQDTTSRLLGPVYNQLRDSEIVDSLATKKLGLPDNYGEQLDQTKGALETAYSKLGTDDKANRRIISDLFIGNDPNLNLLKRGAEQFTNESGTIANYQNKTNLAKFQDSFKENSPLFKGLNKDERGLKGSLGNWRLSNLGTKIVGDNLEGTNNIADLASNIIDTAGTNKATQSFVKTVKGGAPTVKSIIEGALPKFGQRRTGGKGNTIRMGGGNTPLSIIPDTIIPEVLPLPTTTAQGGTNATDLASIQQQAYNNQMSIYGMNPNYFAQIQQPRFNRPTKRFRNVFNRGYF